MVGYWNSEEVFNRINMGEGFTPAALFDALQEQDTADHIIREVWEDEAEGDRDPLPCADGHGSRLSEEGVPSPRRGSRPLRRCGAVPLRPTPVMGGLTRGR